MKPGQSDDGISVDSDYRAHGDAPANGLNSGEGESLMEGGDKQENEQSNEVSRPFLASLAA